MTALADVVGQFVSPHLTPVKLGKEWTYGYGTPIPGVSTYRQALKAIGGPANLEELQVELMRKLDRLVDKLAVEHPASRQRQLEAFAVLAWDTSLAEVLESWAWAAHRAGKHEPSPHSRAVLMQATRAGRLEARAPDLILMANGPWDPQVFNRRWFIREHYIRGDEE